ncbi:MAG: hypothetical protein AB7Q97_09240 [Gammaproteobacteria bacterium]
MYAATPRPVAGPAALALVLAFACAGCDRSASEAWFPLEAGRSWQYVATVTRKGEPRSGRHFVTNTGAGTVLGVHALSRRVQGGDTESFRHVPDGIVRVATRRGQASAIRADPPHHYVLKLPPVPGAAWRLPSRLRLVESRTFAIEDRLAGRTLEFVLDLRVAAVDQRVRVPYGSFENCVRVDGRGARKVLVNRGRATAGIRVRTSDWYARGIGLVKSVREESTASEFLASGSYSLELEAMFDGDRPVQVPN